MTVKVKTGKHKIRISFSGMKDIKKTVSLKPGDEYKLVVKYLPLDDTSKKKKGSTMPGIILGGAGLVVAGTSFVINLDDIAAEMTPDYEGYVMVKNITIGGLIGGIALLGGGIVFILLNPEDTSSGSADSITMSIFNNDKVGIYLNYSYAGM